MHIYMKIGHEFEEKCMGKFKQIKKERGTDVTIL